MSWRSTALLVLSSCLVAPNLHATPAHKWSHSYGDAAEQVLSAVIADPFGSTILCGYFRGSMTFSTTMTSLGLTSDMFIAKLDPNGNPLWNRRIGFGTTGDVGRDVAADPVGNIIAVGASGPEIVIAKYAPDGTQSWIKFVGAAGNVDHADVVATDAGKEIIVAGQFGGDLNFGGPSDTLVTFSNNDIFLVKFDQNGNHLWSKSFSVTGNETVVKGLEVDPAGHIVLFGQFDSSVNFGGGPLTSLGSLDLFLARFASNGDHMWSHRYGGTGAEEACCLAVGETGRMAIAANLYATVNFGGGLLTPTGFPEAGVAVFTPEGNHAWSRNFASSSYSFAQGMAFAQNSDLVFAGYGWGPIDFGGGPVSSTGFFYNTYIARLFQSDGAHRWSASYAGDGNLYGYVAGFKNDLIVAGNIEGTVDLGGGSLTYNGWTDVYAARFGDILTAVQSAPRVASLEQNVPNPFNPATTIGYTLQASAHVIVGVYDASGTLVARLDDGVKSAGAHSIAWNGRDDAGHAVASGVYFYRIEGVPGVDARKMVLLK